eukprot:365016-Chlamydomonas_euryale.AAC.12
MAPVQCRSAMAVAEPFARRSAAQRAHQLRHLRKSFLVRCVSDSRLPMRRRRVTSRHRSQQRRSAPAQQCASTSASARIRYVAQRRKRRATSFNSQNDSAAPQLASAASRASLRESSPPHAARAARVLLLKICGGFRGRGGKGAALITRATGTPSAHPNRPLVDTKRRPPTHGLHS